MSSIFSIFKFLFNSSNNISNSLDNANKIANTQRSIQNTVAIIEGNENFIKIEQKKRKCINKKNISQFKKILMNGIIFLLLVIIFIYSIYNENYKTAFITLVGYGIIWIFSFYQDNKYKYENLTINSYNEDQLDRCISD